MGSGLRISRVPTLGPRLEGHGLCFCEDRLRGTTLGDPLSVSMSAIPFASMAMVVSAGFCLSACATATRHAVNTNNKEKYQPQHCDKPLQSG